jgi:hypothetical protein
MFVPPTIPQPPESLAGCIRFLNAGNTMLENLIKFQREQFQEFWFKDRFTLKTPEEVNEWLAHMDAAQPGQSYKCFVDAKALVDFIEVLSPGRLTQDDWYPRYDYTVDPQTYSLRVIPPVEPEPDPEQEP